MADVSLAFRDIAAERSTVLADLGLEPGAYLLLTAHRAGNVDAPERLRLLVELLEALPAARSVFPVHPRTEARLEAAGLFERLERAEHVELTPPLGYLDFLELARNARAVLTDSGGVQKEAYLLGVPCVTLRDTHRVGRDRGGGLERARGPRPRARAGRAGASRRRRSGPSSTAAAGLQSGFATWSPPTLRAYEDRDRRTRLRGPAAGGGLRRGGPRRGGRGHRQPRDGRARGGALARGGRARRGAAGHLRPPPDHHPLRRPGQGRRDRGGGAHAAHREPRARPAAADRVRHRAGRRAPGRPARGARVDHLSGHHARALRAAARGVGPGRRARLPPGLLARSGSTPAAPTSRCATRPRSSAG